MALCLTQNKEQRENYRTLMKGVIAKLSKNKFAEGMELNTMDNFEFLWEKYTGKPFDCACGKTHIYNNLTSPPFVDGGMYKMGLMVKECKHLSSVKVRGFFNTDKMELLFGCKFEEKKKRFGFTLEYPKFDEEIKIWIAERWEL